MRSTLAALATLLTLSAFSNAYHVDWSREIGPFYLKHFSSHKYLHPYKGSQHPGDTTPVVIHSGYHDACLFSYIPVADKPGFGLIKHWTSGKFLHPHRGSFHPGDGTGLVIHGGHHYATLWAINTATRNIMHIGGKFLHPRGGSVNPGDQTQVVLHSDTHEAT